MGALNCEMPHFDWLRTIGLLLVFPAFAFAIGLAQFPNFKFGVELLDKIGAAPLAAAATFAVCFIVWIWPSRNWNDLSDDEKRAWNRYLGAPEDEDV